MLPEGINVTEGVHQVMHHEGGQLPGAIRRADRLYRVFEDGGGAEKAARTGCNNPSVLRNARCGSVEFRDIIIKTEAGSGLRRQFFFHCRSEQMRVRRFYNDRAVPRTEEGENGTVSRNRKNPGQGM
jgi:hypothetical protein